MSGGSGTQEADPDPDPVNSFSDDDGDHGDPFPQLADSDHDNGGPEPDPSPGPRDDYSDAEFEGEEEEEKVLPGGAHSPGKAARIKRNLALMEKWRKGEGRLTAPAGPGGGAGGGKRPPKPAFVIDFSCAAEKAKELHAAPLDTKRTTLLPARTKASDTTLAFDSYNATAHDLEKLFDKPERTVAYHRKKVQRAIRRRRRRSTGNGDFDDDDPAAASGSSSPLPDLQSDSDHDADPGPDDDDEPLDWGKSSPKEGSTSEGLVVEPPKPTDTKIEYARRAKNVDVRALKESVWGLIQEGSEPSGPGGQREVDFQTILDGLHSKVSPSMLSELSISFCFYATLHLANEQGLQVVQTEEDAAGLAVRMPQAKK